MAPRNSWNRVPAPDERVRRVAVQHRRGGERWSGSWTVQGEKLYVESAYGSRTAKIDPENASDDRANALLAERLLAEIVDARRGAL